MSNYGKNRFGVFTSATCGPRNFYAVNFAVVAAAAAAVAAVASFMATTPPVIS
ncbi:MAG TPA: hypothetical protein PKK48_03630 [Phycisphaerae bacterium]|nr:hypothetical protein [Phycisphaerae bacterium]HPS52342.1 hypothetical protein [Phycisphaerae bacterium]